MLPEIVVGRTTRERLSLALALLRDRAGSETLEFLEQELARARRVADDEVPQNVAALDTLVQYRDELSGETHFGTLVYPGFERTTPGGISVFTALGASLLGLAEGQSMRCILERGVACHVTLEKVLHTAAEADIHIRHNNGQVRRE